MSHFSTEFLNPSDLLSGISKILLSKKQNKCFKSDLNVHPHVYQHTYSVKIGL